MKNIKLQFALRVTTMVVVMFLSLTSSALASGYSPYGPYGPHNPVDTSVAGTDIFSIVGLGLYGVGSILISSASKLKGIISK